MHLTSCHRNRLLPMVTAALALAALLAPMTAGAQCTITPGDGGQLCGPEGYGAYYWAPPGGGVQTTRCITATEPGVYSLRVGASLETLGEPCYYEFGGGGDLKCDITGPGEACEGESFELCGPEGDYEYSWSGPGGFTASTRCITAGALGTYTLELTDPSTKRTCRADHVVAPAKDCKQTFNCPRTPGFWSQQCAQRRNGSTKFSLAQMNSITACVDDKSAYFDWGSADFAGFCSKVADWPQMNQRQQAERQYAAFLANLCTDELNLIANNGDEILLDPATVISYGGQSMTIGELQAHVDARLIALAGQSLDLPAVKSAYSAIISILDDINNARGIGDTCFDEELSSLSTLAARPAGTGAVELSNPYPNPFAKGVVRMQYAVGGAGADVKIGVYDLSGRLVRELVNGFAPAGRHEIAWDGLASDGSRVRPGMYFVQSRIAGEPAQSRRLIKMD